VRFAVVAAAGSGKRFGGKKQFFEVNGKPIVEYSLAVLERSEFVHGIVVVLPEEDLPYGERLKERFSKIEGIVAGGAERQESVYNGLKFLKGRSVREVFVHDGARPLLEPWLVRELVIAISDYEVEGVVPGVKPRDTVKEVGAELEPGDHFVKKTLNRDRLVLVQTPQLFNFEVLLECHERARKEGFEATDDAALLERYGYSVVVIPGSFRNVKVTTREDLAVVKAFLACS